VTKNQSRSATESVLIVGSTGTVGSELVKQLAASGRRVKALVRDEGKAAGIAHLAAPVIGDLAVPATLEQAFKGAERVFLLSPPIPEIESLDRNAFEAAVAAGAKRIVFLSNYGAGEFGDDDYHFTAHAANERRLMSLDVDWTILRPTRFMTHTPFVWSSVLQRNLLLEGGVEGAMTVIDPVDIAAVALLALTGDGHEGETYNLTSEDSFTVLQLANLLSLALGRDLDIFHGDTEELRAALVECGAPEVYAPLMAGYFAMVAAGRFRVTDTVSRLLGRKPRTYAQWLDRNLPLIRSGAA
jgi:uncharacterized protein YbjT (DUF2867 family)